VVTKLRERKKTRHSTLKPVYDWREIEAKVRSFTITIRLRDKIRQRLSSRKKVGYVEGPPTLNNEPHIGHVRTRVMKDLWYRFNTLRGKNIVFRGGWDTQGLPVELQAEKELGLSGNKWENLRRVGEERLVEECKNLVRKYEKSWMQSDELLGLLLDNERAYRTYDDAYIEREWKYLEKAWNRGVLGEGNKVVAYCPNCLTSLSHAEVALGYETLDDPSLYYKVRADDGSYLVIWTTMPFTVVTDELVAVKPGAEYQYVKVGGETWVVGAERKDALTKDIGVEFGEVVRRVRGSDLEGLKYTHPLLDVIPGLTKLVMSGAVHKVVAEEFVDTTSGTGVVHLSPANGEDDYDVATRRNVPIFSPIGDEAHFTEESGRFSGMFVRDADELVSSLLKERGALVFEGRTIHEYPTCWRSGHRLVWVVRREYFYWLDRIGKRLTRAAERVEYFFDSPRNRFLEFIKESRPWCITRERVWGTPLPIWVCSSCGEKTPAFSRKRIIDLALKLPDGPDFELHRPWIDRIVVKCPHCGSSATREPFVLDTWHNSGAAPYASFTDQEYRRLVPVEFLTEAIDQTRGWAYTLLVLNVILSGRPVPPYKAFLFQGFVLDEKGRKMSKSLGNFVTGLDVLGRHSVDLVRFYLLWKSSPQDSLSFDEKEMMGRPYQVLNTLYHLHVYLSQNGALDGYKHSRHTLGWSRRKGLLSTVDMWLLSKLGALEKEVAEMCEEGRYNEACRSLEQFVIETLSQNYVRMVRGELWSDSRRERDRRLAIFSVLGDSLLRVDLLMHPPTPHVTEYLYQEACAEGPSWRAPILVSGFKEGRPLRSGRAEKFVEAALMVEYGSNSARMRASLKRRWPLRRIFVLVPERQKAEMKSARALISTLCNVREVEVVTKPSDFPVSFSLSPNPSRVGVLFKEQTREVLAHLARLEGTAAWHTYLAGKGVTLRLASGKLSVPAGVFELKFEENHNFEAVERGGVFVAIEKARDEKLVAEGLVRDVARRLQALRKEKGYSPTAMLSEARVAGLDDEELDLLDPFKKELSFLVRVRTIKLSSEKGAGDWHEDELGDKPIYIDVS